MSRDDRVLPGVQGPDGQPVTYGMAREYASLRLTLTDDADADERVLAKLVLALIRDGNPDA